MIDLTVKSYSANHYMRNIFTVVPFINEVGSIVYQLLLVFLV